MYVFVPTSNQKLKESITAMEFKMKKKSLYHSLDFLSLFLILSSGRKKSGKFEKSIGSLENVNKLNFVHPKTKLYFLSKI